MLRMRRQPGLSKVNSSSLDNASANGVEFSVEDPNCPKHTCLKNSIDPPGCRRIRSVEKTPQLPELSLRQARLRGWVSHARRRGRLRHGRWRGRFHHVEAFRAKGRRHGREGPEASWETSHQRRW